MTQKYEFFKPDKVDEQIARFLPENRTPQKPQEETVRQPEHRLVRDLQDYYQAERQQDLASLERAWHYVSKHLDASQTPYQSPGRFSSAKMLRFPYERTHRMQMQAPEQSLRKKLSRSFGLLVAVLVIALLVGSMTLVLNLSQRSSTIGSPSTQASSSPIGTLVYTSPKINTVGTGFTDIAWSPDSKRVAVATPIGVQIWDATTGKHPVQVQVPADPTNGSVYVYRLAWSPNSQMLAIAARQNLLVVDGQSGAIVHSYSANARTTLTTLNGPYLSALLPASGISGFLSLGWSPDGRFLAVSLASGAGRVEVLDAQTGERVFDLPTLANAIPTEFAWSSDGQYLAAYSNAGFGETSPMAVWAWKLSTLQIVFQHPSSTAASENITWQPGSHNLAFFTNENTQVELGVWNVASGQQVRHYEANCSGPLAWSPNAKELACVQGQDALLIDATSGKPVYTYQGKDPISALAWSPDGQYVATGEGGITTPEANGPSQPPASSGVVVVWTA
jgi:WD40 repeat protein